MYVIYLVVWDYAIYLVRTVGLFPLSEHFRNLVGVISQEAQRAAKSALKGDSVSGGGGSGGGTGSGAGKQPQQQQPKSAQSRTTEAATKKGDSHPGV